MSRNLLSRVATFHWKFYEPASVAWVLASTTVGFAAPTVTSVTPRSLPYEGGVITLLGSDFGDGQCGGSVQLLLTQAPTVPGIPVFSSTSLLFSSSGLVRALTPCSVTQWSRSSISCVAPPGLDAAVAVTVTVAGQANVTSGLFGYAPPALTNVTALGPVGTPGGASVVVTGEGLPSSPWPIAVLVGSSVCVVDRGSVSQAGAAALACTVPRGAGSVQVRLVVPVAGPSNPLALLYAPPRVVAVGPARGRPIEGGFPVTVTGEVGASKC